MTLTILPRAIVEQVPAQVVRQLGLATVFIAGDRNLVEAVVLADLGREIATRTIVVEVGNLGRTEALL